MSVLGMDGWRVFTAEDPAELLALMVMTEEAVKYAQQRDRALAIEIANAVGKLFK